MYSVSAFIGNKRRPRKVGPARTYPVPALQAISNNLRELGTDAQGFVRSCASSRGRPGIEEILVVCPDRRGVRPYHTLIASACRSCSHTKVATTIRYGSEDDERVNTLAFPVYITFTPARKPAASSIRGEMETPHRSCLAGRSALDWQKNIPPTSLDSESASIKRLQRLSVDLVGLIRCWA